MSNFVEVKPGEMINLDNVRSVKKNEAKNGGRPMLMVSYVDCVGCPVVFEDHKELCFAYNKIKSNKI